jgi:hypothetical protein
VEKADSGGSSATLPGEGAIDTMSATSHFRRVVMYRDLSQIRLLVLELDVASKSLPP